MTIIVKIADIKNDFLYIHAAPKIINLILSIEVLLIYFSVDVIEITRVKRIQADEFLESEDRWAAGETSH